MLDLNTFASTKDYEDYRFNLLVLAEGNTSTVTLDTKNIPTIGIGYNLRANMTAVAKEILGGSYRDTLRDQLLSIVNKAYAKGQASLVQSQLDQVLQNWHDTFDKNTPVHFTLDETQSKNVLNAIQEKYEKDIEQHITNVSLSQERAVLFSLDYNNGDSKTDLLGSSLITDIQNGNRAEAWYEIRYRSNADGVQANRRYVEAYDFQLYKTAGVATKTEAHQAAQMYTDHRTAGKSILQYELTYSPATAAKVKGVAGLQDIYHELQPAITEFKTEYGINTKAQLQEVQMATDSIVNLDGDGGAGGSYDDPDKNQNDLLIGSSAANTLHGNKGNDVLLGLSGDDLLYGDEGDDTIYGNDGKQTANGGNDKLYGGAGDDKLYASDGTNELYGGDGDDKIYLTKVGQNIVDGGPGDNTLDFTDATQAITLDLSASGNNRITHIQTIIGTVFNDTFTDGKENVTLKGGAGNDTYIYANNTVAHVDTINDSDGKFALKFWQNFAQGITLPTDTYGTGWNIGNDAMPRWDFIFPDTQMAISVLYNATTHTAYAFTSIAYQSLLNKDFVIEEVGGNFSVGLSADKSQIIFSYTPITHGNNGSASADYLQGSDTGSLLSSFAGNDTVVGGLGNDTIIGGAGADVLNGGGGVNTASYAGSTAAVNVNLALTTAQTGGDAAGDILTNIQNLIGSSLNDTMTGSASANVFDGGGGIDLVSYANSTAAVTVNLLTNVHSGGYAAGDSLINISNLTGSNYNDNLTGNAAANTLAGGSGNDFLYGGAGNDSLDGGAGTDSIYGGDGNDTLIGSTGYDTLDGGAGTNTASYASYAAYVGVDLTSNSQWSSDSSYDTLLNIQNVIGSGYNDYLNGNAVANSLSGGAGDDTLQGGAGNDTLDGGAGNDALYGGDGDDLLIGGLGSDYLDGGAGTNTASYAGYTQYVGVDLASCSQWSSDSAYDTLLSNIQNVIGTGYNDYINGNASNNSITGGAGNDSLTGNDGNDTLDGGAGDDALYGGNGNDLIVGGAGSDYIDGGAGTDTISYAASTTWVNVDLGGNSHWNGDAAWDSIINVENIIGSNYNDQLFGNAGANSINGGAGNDLITGGGGADTLTGGTGNDNFVFKAVSDSATATPDLITDFTQGSDHIDVRGLGLTSIAAGAATSGHLGYSYDSTANQTSITSTTGMKILLVGHVNLVNNDFMFT